MKRYAFLLLFIALLLTSCSRQTGVSKRLRVQGREIVDQKGARVLMRAVGLGNWLLPEGYMWKFGKNADRPRTIEKLIADLIGEKKAAEFWQRFRADYITEADIARIKELGFNTVRPAINWRVLMDENTGKLDKRGFKLLDNLIHWCTEHEVYVVLDLHGAPGGQTGANIDDSANDFPELFTDQTAQQRFITLWAELAKRYRSQPYVVAYDLLNEPLPEKFNQFNADLEPLYRRAVEAIRQVDAHTMIMLEGSHWSTDFSVFGPPFDDNTVYQFHKYWSTPDTKSIEPFLQFREQHTVPLWMGESGENNNDWYWAAYQLFEDHKIGWLLWPWKKLDTQNTPYSIKRPEGWEKIIGFSRGGEKPTPDEAERILNQYLQNIKLENCEFYPEVINAVFRRIPARVQAENYGHEGEGLSYELINTESRAEYYRINEPVPIIELIEEDDSKTYAVRLQADEWLAYEFNSTIDQVTKVMIKVRSDSKFPNLHVEIDGKEIEVSRNYFPGKFYYNASRPFTLKRGTHEIKLVVTQGEMIIDWFEFQ